MNPLHAMVQAFEDETDERLPDADGRDQEIMAACLSAAITNTEPVGYAYVSKSGNLVLTGPEFAGLAHVFPIYRFSN